MSDQITLYNFNNKDLNNRMEIVNQQGIYLDYHVKDLERCNLYSVGMFFVEVVYNSESNSITEIKSFKSGRLLDKYSNVEKGY